VGPRLAVRGTIEGRRLRRDDVRIESVVVRLGLDQVPARPGGTAAIAVRGARIGDTAAPDLTLTEGRPRA
jgi:hypothetical protein